VWVWLCVFLVLGLTAFVWSRIAAAKAASAAKAAALNPPALPVVATKSRTGDIGVYYSGLGAVTPFAEQQLATITIISRLPAASVGALLALLPTHTDLSIIAIIGIILPIGIVKKNAIMTIDFALAAARNEGKSAGGLSLLRQSPAMVGRRRPQASGQPATTGALGAHPAPSGCKFHGPVVSRLAPFTLPVRPRACLSLLRRSKKMLWTICIILLVLWVLGMLTSYTAGGLLHILLAIALAVMVIRLLQGRRAV
jgi:hypothetical protein